MSENAAPQVSFVEVGKEEAEQFTPVFQFKEIGQCCIGKYKEQRESKDGKFGPETHYILIGKNPETKEPFEFAINPNADLKKRLSVVKIGQILRITYTNDKDTGQTSPMRQFKVEVAQGGPASAGAAPAAAPSPKPSVPQSNPADLW